MARWPDWICKLCDPPKPVGKQERTAYEHIKTEHKLTFDPNANRWESPEGLHYNTEQVLERKSTKKGRSKKAVEDPTAAAGAANQADAVLRNRPVSFAGTFQDAVARFKLAKKNFDQARDALLAKAMEENP